MSQYLRMAIALCVVVAGMFLFLPRDQALGASLTMAALVVTVVLGQLPVPKRFILRNPRAITIAGWALAGLGITVGVAVGWNTGQDEIYPGIAASAVGIALATLPRSLKAMEEAKGQPAKNLKVSPSAVDDGLGALALPFRDLRTSAKVLGPWLALFVGASLTIMIPIFILGDQWIKGMSRNTATLVLFAIMFVVLIMYGALMVAAIQWSRFVAEERPPAFGIPWRSLWSFAWRWIVFGSFSRIPNGFGPWLLANAPSLPHWASVSLTSLASLAFLTLLSPMGLVLPAVALQAKDTSIMGTMASRRVYGRRFYLGALVVLSPFSVVSWLFELLPSGASASMASGAVALVLIVIWVPILFLTVTGAMAYLTKVRMAAASAA